MNSCLMDVFVLHGFCIVDFCMTSCDMEVIVTGKFLDKIPKEL